ncbi:efflux RND transporter periplasmic adaptor subunit [Maritimibacter fusiformis]|nr:efflux RND transporter periplasmic adaptor subunit [Maritimibacter fusiformis]
MSSSRLYLRLRRLAVLVLLVAIAGGYAWWAKPWVTKPVQITVETVTPGPASQVLAVNGQIVPGNKVDLGAPVAGQVLEVLVKEGDAVTKGQALARLDDTSARAALDQAQASLESARIDAQAAKTSYERALALAATVSAQALDSARFSSEAAAARVRQLEAALAQTRQQLSLYQVKSPIAGTVLGVAAEMGQVVGTASALFTVGDLAAPLVETDVDEVYGALMKSGLEALVAPVGSQDEMAAMVSFVAPTVNPDTGGRTVRLSFDAPLQDVLPSGLTMSVNIVVDTYDEAIAVPRTAIRDLFGNPYVMLDDAGTSRRAPVQVRIWPSDRLIVTEGLAAGDRVITDPQDVGDGVAVATETGA